MKGRHVAVTLVSVALLVIATAAGGNPAAVKELGSIPIFTGVDPIFGSLFIAQDRGLFKKNGVIVDIHVFPSGAAAVQAARSAKAGLTLSADLPALKTWEGRDFIGIAPTEWDTQNKSLVVAKDIKVAKDLRGKTVATVFGSNGQINLANYLAKHGLSAEAKAVNLQPAEMVAALAKGEIQGFLWTYPAAHKAIAAIPGVHILAKGVPEGLIPEYSILSAPLTTVERNAEAVVAVLRGFRDADTFITTHPQEAAQTLAKTEGIALDTAAAIIGFVHFDLTYNQSFVDVMTLESDLAVKLKLLRHPVDLKREFAPQFLARLGQGFVTVKR